MKRLTRHLLAVLLLANADPAIAAITSKSYAGSYNGVACTVQVNWHNWSGLGPIDGRINLANGTTISFSGRNTQSGILEFKGNGTSFRLVRRGVGRKVSWVGSNLSFAEASAPTPTPTPTPTPSPTPEVSESKMVESSYSGSWRGKEFTAQIRWAPGDSPEVIRTGRGTGTLSDGTQFVIEAWQPSAESTEFSLAPDESGETYKTTKNTSDGKVAWESSSLTLTEKN